MRARALALGILLTGVVGLAGCSEETRDAVRDAVEEAQGSEGADAAPTGSEAGPTEPAAPVDTAEAAEPAAPVDTAEPTVPAVSTAPVEAESPPPVPDEPADQGVDEAEIASAVALGVVLLLVVLLVVIILARRRAARPHEGSTAAVVSGHPYWQARARTAYADVRWLQDRLDVTVAAWRGLELAAPQETDPDDPRERDWRGIERRLPGTLDELYDLEAHAPGPAERQAVEQVTRSLQHLDDAVGDLARHLRDHPNERAREPAGGASGPPDRVIDLGPAQGDEVRDARARLTRALGDLQVLLRDEDASDS